MLKILVFLFLGACASSSTTHEVRMPQAPSKAGLDTERGQIQLVFSREASNVVVAIDGTLIVERPSAKRILIAGVETGYVNLSIAADGVERSTRVWIDGGVVTAVPVGNPGSPPERLNPLATTALSIVAFLLSRAATDFLF